MGHSRSKPGKKYNLAQAQTLFGSDRESVEVAYPGDVIGINNPGNFAIGYVRYFFRPLSSHRFVKLIHWSRGTLRSNVLLRYHETQFVAVIVFQGYSVLGQREDSLPRHSIILARDICLHT